MTRPRVVYVAPASPWPRNFGGSMRVASLLAVLERRADVDLHVVGDDPGEAARRELADRGATLWPAAVEGRAARVTRIFSSALRGRSIPAARLLWPSRVRELLARIAASQPDLVILGDAFLGELARPLVRDGRRVIVDTHNVESALWRDMAAMQTSPLRGAGYALLAVNTQAHERRVLPIAGRVWAVTAEDAEQYRNVLDLAAVDVVPNVLEARDEARPATEDDALLFTAFYAYPPNEDAAMRLLEVSRELERRGQAHRLHLVGRSPSRRMLAAASTNPRVEVTGEVASIEPWMEKAAVFVAPMRVGSGTNFKILEAMLAGRPVVTTPVGARGLGLEDGRHALVRPIERFADAVAELLADAALSRSLAEAGRHHALTHFTETSLETALAASLDALGIE